MQNLSNRVITALDNLPGFPPKPSTPTATPQAGQFLLGTYLKEIKLRPGVVDVVNLPATGNTLSDVRFVLNAQTFYFWDGAAWQPIAGAGGGGIPNPQITGQTTAGLAVGDVCYTSAANTWSKAQGDGSYSQATSLGIYEGTAGTISLSGSPIAALRCTTAGGLPAINAPLYLALASDDAGTGAGKVTATPPTPPPAGTVQLTVVGTCVDNSNYAGLKTVKAVFQPAYPIILRG